MLEGRAFEREIKARKEESRSLSHHSDAEIRRQERRAHSHKELQRRSFVEGGSRDPRVLYDNKLRDLFH